MGSLFSTLDIARNGMTAAQVQLSVAGHNIANVNREGFSRQRVELTTNVPIVKPYGILGQGPAIGNVARIRDVFLDEAFRQRVPGLGSAEVRAMYYERVEDIFLEPTENGFSNQLNRFFDALNDFANNVEEVPARVSVMAEAQALAGSLNNIARGLSNLQTNANEDIRSIVSNVNSLAGRIAELNVNIARLEAGGREANDLRDDRDLLVDQLAQLVNVSTHERTDGQYVVFLGGDELVSGRIVRTLAAEPEATLSDRRDDLLAVRFEDTGREAYLTGGELHGTLEMRDVEVAGLMNQVDDLARALIQNVNAIQSSGNGLDMISDPLAASYAVTDSTVPLNAAGLPFPVGSGSFDIVVYDAAGSVLDTVTVTADGDTTTIIDLQIAINSSSYLTANVQSNGILLLTQSGGTTITFANDTAGVLPALGWNGLFTGDDALSIGVSQDLIDHPEWLSSGFSLDPLETGDNSAALAMAALRDAALLTNGSQTLNEFYESTVVDLGINARANVDNLEVEKAFVEDFNKRRQEVSGVNLDEEVSSLIQFQRAYEGAARVVTVTDRMLDALLNMVQ